jgi:TetR/AcrR family transcriptional regulator, mexJK operon transcriptional repressor
MAVNMDTREESQRSSSRRERCTAEVRSQAIVNAATEVFLERGYAEASVDAIVERAGGSKATVYALFGNKEGLFEAAITQGCGVFAALVGAVRPEASLEQNLRHIAQAYLKVLFDPKRLAMFRVVAGESGRQPEIGDIFFRNAPRNGTKIIANVFRESAARGQIDTPEPELLAGYFLSALRGDLFLRALFNPTRAPTASEIEQHIEYVIATFLRSCQPKRPARQET